MPSHSEVLPSLPYVSALPGASLRARAPGTPCAWPWSHHISLSSFWTPSQGGGGKKKSTLFTLLFLSQALIMTLTCFGFCLFVFYCLFFLGLVLLIPFLYLPHPSSFFVLKYNQECGKLEGDRGLCPSQGDGGWEMLGLRQGWRRSQASPQGLVSRSGGTLGLSAPQSSLDSANGLPAV